MKKTFIAKMLFLSQFIGIFIKIKKTRKHGTIRTAHSFFSILWVKNANAKQYSKKQIIRIIKFKFIWKKVRNYDEIESIR